MTDAIVKPKRLFPLAYEDQKGVYWHPSNVLYHYGEADCPLQDGDFIGAMHLCYDAAQYELYLAKLANEGLDTSDAEYQHFVAVMSRYATNALSARDVYINCRCDTAKTVQVLHSLAAKVRANDGADNEDSASNYDLFADALDGNDYAALAL